MNDLLGTWKLHQYIVTENESRVVSEPFGSRPEGVISFTPDARMYAFLVPENRQPPAEPMGTDEEKIRLYSSMLSYAGSYSVEGDRVSVLVDVSWNQAWTGSTQVRWFAVEGKKMTLSFKSFSMATGLPALYELIFAKVEQVEPVNQP